MEEIIDYTEKSEGENLKKLSVVIKDWVKVTEGRDVQFSGVQGNPGADTTQETSGAQSPREP